MLLLAGTLLSGRPLTSKRKTAFFTAWKLKMPHKFWCRQLLIVVYMSPNASAVANGATTKEPKDGRLLKVLQNKFNVSCDTNSLLRHVPPWRKVKIFARSEELNGPAASVSSTASISNSSLTPWRNQATSLPQLGHASACCTPCQAHIESQSFAQLLYKVNTQHYWT